jgi:hypothetical protein
MLVVAGDLNLDVSKYGAAMTLARAGLRDPLGGAPTPTTPPRWLFEPGLQIDWAFVRGRFRQTLGWYANVFTRRIVIHYRSASSSLVRLIFRAISVELLLTSFDTCQNRVGALHTLAGCRLLHSPQLALPQSLRVQEVRVMTLALRMPVSQQHVNSRKTIQS